MRADSSVDEFEFELELEFELKLELGCVLDVVLEEELPAPELFKRPARAESRKRAARSAVGARSSVGPPRKSSRK